ncbi:MAG: hypothetical protein LBU53_02425, partial [Zoogloeaceae bacterium]|nr:hypothetical protein [Zoogloeaceae bacterium]
TRQAFLYYSMNAKPHPQRSTRQKHFRSTHTLSVIYFLKSILQPTRPPDQTPPDTAAVEEPRILQRKKVLSTTFAQIVLCFSELTRGAPGRNRTNS